MAKKNAPTESGDTLPPSDKKEITVSDLFKDLIAGYGENRTDAGQQICNRTISNYLKQEAIKIECYSKYNILFFI